MGRTTPRALDGVVDGVVKQSEEQSSSNGDSTGDVTGGSKEAAVTAKTGDGGNDEKEDKDGNGMQTFFTKVGLSLARGVVCVETASASDVACRRTEVVVLV